MLRELSMAHTLGVIGSLIGIGAGLASLVNTFNMSTLTVGAYITEVGLWIFWFVIQGSAFLAIYRERNDNAALAAFILAVISALIEASIMIVLLSAPSITEIAEVLATLLQLFFAILIGTFTEATYLILSGIAVLHMTRYGAKESIAYGTGIILILAGCIVGLGFFGALSLLIPAFIIASNIMACILFIYPQSTESQLPNTKESDSGLALL